MKRLQLKTRIHPRRGGAVFGECPGQLLAGSGRMRMPRRLSGTLSAGTGSDRRGGAVIIVVLALMTVLMFLGMFFFFFADEARLIAENVANTQDQEDGFTIDSEKILNHGLEQVITYTPGQYTNSALYGGQYSLLAHEIGTLNPNGQPRDLTLFNGLGVNVVVTTTTDTSPADGHPDVTTQSQFFVDRNGDGAADTEDANGNGMLDPGEDINGNGSNDPLGLLGYAFNLSALANPFAATAGTPLANFSAFGRVTPDAGYTYADANSLFLAYEDTTSGVVIPSFFRPQLFPDERSSAAAQNTFSFLYNTAGPNGDYKLRVLRPHLLHTYTPISLPLNATKRRQLRYLDTQTPAQSGDRTRALQPFPFQVEVNGNGVFNEAGLLSKGSTAYEFDVDSDLDGVRDSIYIDLDHPMITMPDGRQFVPIYHFKIEDADALLNVNAHGNLNRLAATEDVNRNGGLDPGEDVNGNGAIDSVTLPPSTAVSKSIHSSTLGLSVSEINPAWALTGNPKEFVPATPSFPTSLLYLMREHQNSFNVDATPNKDPGRYFSNVPLVQSRLATSNMELAMMMFGRGDSYGSPQPFWPLGRWGQDGILNSNQFGFRGPGHVVNPSNPGPPTPDDDGDGALGGLEHQDDFLSALIQPPFVHPLDYRGRAEHPYVGAPPPNVFKYQRSLLQPSASSPARWPNYDGNWQEQGTASVPGVRTLRTTSMQPGADPSGLINEPNETLLNRARRRAPHPLTGEPTSADALYGPQEMAALHLSSADWSRTGNDSRLRELLQYNFEHSEGGSSTNPSTPAALIRGRFTTDTWDRKEFTFTPDLNRPWEFNDPEDANNNGRLDPGEDTDGDNALDARFPPKFGTAGTVITSRHENRVNTANDPFRPVLRRLLTVVVSPGDAQNFGSERLRPQHKLDINKLLVNYDQYGNPIYRELMPHPVFLNPSDPGYNRSQDDPTMDSNSYLISGTDVRPMFHGNVSFRDNNNRPTNHYEASWGNPDLLDPQIEVPASAPPTFQPVPLTAAATNKFAQEAWARYDRQRLARDIYVLLYTLSSSGAATAGGLDQTFPPAGSAFVDPTIAPIDPDVAREMAQFAVNYVDALDRDSVITKFQYDNDLSDGWANVGLLDVYGVERQELSFGEVLFVQTTRQANRLNTTLWRDDDTAHQFLYLEVRNSSPFATKLDNETWRIVRTTQDSTTPVAGVQFQRQGGTGNVVKTVQPGRNFMLTSHDGSVVTDAGGTCPSDFWVDWNSSGPTGTNNLEPAIPLDTTATANTEPLGEASGANEPYLDLAWTGTTSPHDHSEFYEYTISFDSLGSTAAQPGRFNTPTSPAPMGATTATPQPTNTLIEPNDAALPFDLVLQRRQNLQANGVGETNWVEVDRVQVNPGATFNPSGDTQTAIINELRDLNNPSKMRSWERREPLYSGDSAASFPPNSTNTLPRHSMDMTPANRDAANTVLPVANGAQMFTLWQPHFDRDFASVMDLLSIPLYGPTFADANNGSYTTLDGSTSWRFSSDGQGRGELMAKRRFLNPQASLVDPNTGNPIPEWDINPPPSNGIDYQNRWYRLLGFLKAQPSEDSADDLTARMERLVAGKLNLNTIRDETVLAGLIDDDVHLNPFGSLLATDDAIEKPMGPPPRNLINPSGRNWYDAVRLSRDGVDPVVYNGGAGPQLTVPGLPGAKPFRTLSFLDPVLANQDRSVDSTVLRDSRPVAPYFGLFDARPSSDVTNTGNFTVDFHTARRILAKVHNLTTVRSHVYIIHCGYDLFEAHQLPNGNVQIGAKSDEMRGARQFLVVDMSRLEEAYNPLTNTFDFQKFIIYRQTLP